MSTVAGSPGRAALAGADPGALWRQPRFWERERAFAAILAASVMLLLALARYTYAWAGGWGLISVAVQALAVWGVVVAARGLARLAVDTALVGEMETRGGGYLADLKSGSRKHVDLDRLEETILPNNPSQPPPGPIRLFQHICKEARDRRFDSGSTLVQPYREEAMEDLFRLQNLQKIALWLGILGTFLGLLVVLEQHDVTPAGAAGEAEIMQVVERMYGGLYVSFTASVAGLEVAIVLGFLLQLLRKRQEAYFAQLESAVVTLLSVARHSINRDDFLAEFSQVNTAVRDLTRRVYEQTRELGEELQSVHQQLRGQNERIDAGLARLAGAGSEFDGFLQKVSDSETAFLRDLASAFHTASFKDFGQALEEGMKRAGSDVAERLKEVGTESAGELRTLHESVQALSAAVEANSRELAQTVAALAPRATATRIGLPFPSAPGDLGRLSAQMEQLSRAIERMAETQHRPRGLRELVSSLSESLRLRRFIPNGRAR
jgi:hypothetical protein